MGYPAYHSGFAGERAFRIPDTELENAKTVRIDFINDVQYRIQTDGESLLVASSDMTFALLYTLDTENYTLENIFDADGWNYNENPITG